jgi:hypothetical protein
MKRHGTVVVFKKGTTRKQAAKALEQIREVLDIGYHFGVRHIGDLVRDFDDDVGGPVWYIP